MSYWPKAYTWHRPDFRYAWTNPEPKLGWPEHGSLSVFVGDNSIGRGLGPERATEPGYVPLHDHDTQHYSCMVLPLGVTFTIGAQPNPYNIA